MRRPSLRNRQRGWVGLIVILIALAIVGWLARDALMQYGLVPGAAPASAVPAERSAISPAGMAPLDPTMAAPAPTAPLDRARAVEGMLQQQADERAKRLEGGRP